MATCQERKDSSPRIFSLMICICPYILLCLKIWLCIHNIHVQTTDRKGERLIYLRSENHWWVISPRAMRRRLNHGVCRQLKLPTLCTLHELSSSFFLLILDPRLLTFLLTPLPTYITHHCRKETKFQVSETTDQNPQHLIFKKIVYTHRKPTEEASKALQDRIFMV